MKFHPKTEEVKRNEEEKLQSQVILFTKYLDVSVMEDTITGKWTTHGVDIKRTHHLCFTDVKGAVHGTVRQPWCAILWTVEVESCFWNCVSLPYKRETLLSTLSSTLLSTCTTISFWRILRCGEDKSRSQWPRGARHGSAAGCLLGLRVRIRPACMDVSLFWVLCVVR